MTHLYLYLFNCERNVSSIHRSNSKNICYQSSHFATKVSTETQSIGIHEVHLFNTELAMHYRAIFNCGYFQLFCERKRLCRCVWSIFLVIKAKQDRSGCLIYCVNDFLMDFLRILKSPDRLDGNENSTFRCQLWLLEENFSHPDS